MNTLILETFYPQKMHELLLFYQKQLALKMSLKSKDKLLPDFLFDKTA